MYLCQGLAIKPPAFLIYVRYSWFILVYPFGMAMEWVVTWEAWPLIDTCCPRVYSVSMPNAWNFAFDFKWFMLGVVVPGYVLIFPMLYAYLWQQRTAKLKTS
jgi:very-long-chain (3R)-3-hydroxyacyl-CoA dehydratase